MIPAFKNNLRVPQDVPTETGYSVTVYPDKYVKGTWFVNVINTDPNFTKVADADTVSPQSLITYTAAEVFGYALGVSGYSGFSGFSGDNPGTSGYSGFSGKSGYSGIGTSGFSGYSGVSGFSGVDGAAGSTGLTGTSGWSGYSGKSGYSGSAGSTGTSGYSGFSGDNPGTSGYSGFSGKSGYSGISGYSSISGYSGISGFSGISGYSGVAPASVVNLQGASPGTPQTGNANLSGVIIAATFQGDLTGNVTGNALTATTAAGVSSMSVAPAGLNWQGGTPPATAGANGTTGTVIFGTDGYLYVCTATNTWKRVQLATW